MNTLNHHEQGQLLLDIELLKQERPLFEANYVKNGGNLKLLKWAECLDGTGMYEIDWKQVEQEQHEGEIEESHFVNEVMAQAELVQACLMSWIECAKSKAIPQGYYLMPIQPSEEMLSDAEKEFNDLDIEDIQDRIVFAHQAMIQVLCRSA